MNMKKLRKKECNECTENDYIWANKYGHHKLRGQEVLENDMRSKDETQD